MGATDPEIEALTERADLAEALEALNERNRWIIRARFLRGETQQQVADALGLSQMHISRLERKALEQLRSAMTTQ
jgi:RNA polymerase sigma-B factor